MEKTPAVWTPLELVKRSAEYLSERGIATARLDAELLLSHVLDMDRMGLYVGFERPTEPAELDRYRALIRQRGQRVPLQRLTGRATVLDQDVEIHDDVFIPRPETESLLQLCTSLPFESNRPVDLVEVGTGTGVISAALLTHWGEAQGHGFEASEAAAKCSQTNLEHVGVTDRFQLHVGDAFDRDCPPCDLLVSNPPYIPTDAIAHLEPEVRDHDPHLALDGGPDGLAFIRRLLRWGVEAIRPGGWVVLEHGDGQERPCEQLLLAHDLGDVESQTDLAGRPRVIAARR